MIPFHDTLDIQLSRSPGVLHLESFREARNVLHFYWWCVYVGPLGMRHLGKVHFQVQLSQKLLWHEAHILKLFDPSHKHLTFCIFGWISKPKLFYLGSKFVCVFPYFFTCEADRIGGPLALSR